MRDKNNQDREEINANSFYPDSATSRAYVQSSSNPFEIFHYLCKTLLQLLNNLGIPLPCIQDSHNSRDKQSLDHNNSFQKV